MTAEVTKASRLALATVVASLSLGMPALWLGLEQGVLALWAFGGACLLLGLPSLGAWQRIREGFGNRGLERERLTLRAASHLLRLLALGAVLAAAAALMGNRASQASLPGLGLAILAPVILVFLWWAKRSLAGVHPTLDLDAARTRALLDLALLLLVGVVLGRWFPWADAAAGLLMALRLFLAGQALVKVSALQAASCGSCGSCGCG
jgi:hypothetical protein